MDDWSFDIGPVAAIGVVRAVTPPGWALKSVMLDGKDITDTSNDFRMADVGGIDVLLTSHVGSLDGTVQDGDKPALEYGVVVFPDDKDKWTFPSRFVTLARPSQQGAFTVPNLLPGRYLVVAVPALPGMEADPAWLASMRASATPVTIGDGANTKTVLKLIKR